MNRFRKVDKCCGWDGRQDPLEYSRMITERYKKGKLKKPPVKGYINQQPQDAK